MESETRRPAAPRKGGFIQLLTIAYRNIYRNRRRSGLCILAIAITVFFIVVFAALMDGLLSNFRRMVIAYETGHVLLSSKAYEKKSLFLPLQYPLELPGKNLPELVREIEQLPGVRRAFPRIKVRVSLLESTVKNALLWGIDLEEEMKYTVFNTKTGNARGCLLAGRFPAAQGNECAIGYVLAAKMGVGLGDRVRLRLVSSEFSNKFYSPVVTGIVDFNFGQMDDKLIILPFARAQRLATLAGRTQALYVFLEQEGAAEKVAAALQQRYAGYDLSIKPFTRHPYLTLMKSGELAMTIIYVVFMVVASFLIINTIIMVIHERIKEIGMMAALGMTRREIVQVFFLESLILSGLGSLAGCLSSGLATFLVSRMPFDIGSYMGEMMAMNNTLFVTFSPVLIGQGLLYGLAISGACTILPSLRSAFIEPVEAIRR
jgi:putative ABC transport system permease protein